LPAGIAIWLLFGILDLTAIHDPSVPLFYIRIIGTVPLIPMLVATLVLKPGRWMETVGFTAIAIQLPLLSALIVVLSPSSLLYFQPTDIWIFDWRGFVCSMRRLVRRGLILAIGTIFAFFVSVSVFWPAGRARPHGGARSLPLLSKLRLLSWNKRKRRLAN
jgi:hypothetical protein